MHTSLTIIVPVYNEEDNLLRVEEALTKFVKSTVTSTSILFVNDGSSDKSLHHIERICKRQDDFNFISLSTNNGLSTALKVGFDCVTSDLVGYLDADLQTSPEDFNLLLEYVNDYELVTGIRLNRQDSFTKNLSSKIANSFRRVFTKDGVGDTGCPLKIIHTDYAKRIPMFKGLHRFLPAMILLQNGKIKQVPVKHFPRTAGKAKYGLRNRILGPLLDCFAFLWMRKNYINYKINKQY